MEISAVAENGSTEARLSATSIAVVAALGLFLTLLNAVKPLAVDDTVYYDFAAHIAAHPLDPYGFRVWDLQDANRVLAPPVFLYWWAMSIRLLGDNPFLWKLALLPINLLLVFMLHGLGRRFVRGLELPFVCMVALSATVLPCVNLMLDIPALALSLLAITLFLRACDAGSVRGAVVAGLVAGIATQTKYTSFVAPAVMLVYAIQHGKWRQAAVACTLPVLMFVGWEMAIAAQYGHSHFLLGFGQFQGSLVSTKLTLIQPMLGQLGSTMAASVPVALALLGCSRRVVGTALAVVVLAFVFVSFPAGIETLFLYPHPKLTGALFGLIGFVLVGATAAIVRRLARDPRDEEGRPAPRWYMSVDGFLILWLLAELGGFFVLSPYPATRRLIGVTVLGSLVTCRLAVRACQHNRKLLWSAAGLHCLLGLFMFTVDFSPYYGEQVLIDRLAAHCRQQSPRAQLWYVGGSGFEFYGRRQGMKRLQPTGASVAVDDLVVVQCGFEQQHAANPLAARCVPDGSQHWHGPLPVQSGFQCGAVALKRKDEPLVAITLYRVR